MNIQDNRENEMNKLEKMQEKMILNVITARVIEPRKGNAEVVLRNILDGKIGFVRNWEAWKKGVGLGIGDIVLVQLEDNSAERYDSYRYWIGNIMGRTANRIERIERIEKDAESLGVSQCDANEIDNK